MSKESEKIIINRQTLPFVLMMTAPVPGFISLCLSLFGINRNDFMFLLPALSFFIFAAGAFCLPVRYISYIKGEENVIIKGGIKKVWLIIIASMSDIVLAAFSLYVGIRWITDSNGNLSVGSAYEWWYERDSHYYHYNPAYEFAYYKFVDLAFDMMIWFVLLVACVVLYGMCRQIGIKKIILSVLSVVISCSIVGLAAKGGMQPMRDFIKKLGVGQTYAEDLLHDRKFGALRDNDFLFHIFGNTAKIVGYIGDSETMRIPETIRGIPVTAVNVHNGSSVFEPTVILDNNSKIKKIILPKTVKDLNLSEGVPLSMHLYDDQTRVPFLGDFVNLEEILVDDDNQVFSSEDGVLFSKDKTELIGFPMARTGEYSIPEGTRSLYNFAFSHSKLSRIIIPESLIAAGEFTFRNCDNLDEISVAPGNKYFSSGDHILMNAQKSKIITIFGNVPANYVIEPTVTSVAHHAFAVCKTIETLHVPGNVKHLEKFSFWGCDNLVSVTFEEGLEEIGESAFEDCHNLENFELPSSLITLGAYAFSYCPKITKVSIPENITVLNAAFSRCRNLTEINLPDGLTTLEGSALEGCHRLRDVSLPKTVTEIRGWAFGRLRDLRIVIPNPNVEIAWNSFYECENMTFVCPKGTASQFAEEHGFEWILME